MNRDPSSLGESNPVSEPGGWAVWPVGVLREGTV